MGKSQLIILADILSWYFVTEVKQLFAKAFVRVLVRMAIYLQENSFTLSAVGPTI